MKDNGIGFEQQYTDKIFQVFHRLHTTSQYEGSGIGLAIVQRVVGNHQGFVTVESSLGGGTAFRVYLPV